MKIRSLILTSQNLEKQFNFYVHVLGFKLLYKSQYAFLIDVGWSTLEFTSKTGDHRPYHFCFLIPSNQIENALKWLRTKKTIIPMGENNSPTIFFESWNAESFYFNDEDGNVVEFIARFDLKNNTPHEFKVNDIICLNEIGMPVDNVEMVNDLLKKTMGTKLWRGDLIRFGVHGDQEGLLLLPNYILKKSWYPTNTSTHPTPFEAIIEANGFYNLKFDGKEISIEKK